MPMFVSRPRHDCAAMVCAVPGSSALWLDGQYRDNLQEGSDSSMMSRVPPTMATSSSLSLTNVAVITTQGAFHTGGLPC